MMTTLLLQLHFQTTETILQPNLDSITITATYNIPIISTNKSQSTVFNPDLAEYSKSLNLNTSNNNLATNPFPRILGQTFDPKLTLTKDIKYTKRKANKTIKFTKHLPAYHGKTKETLIHTYKSITRPTLEYTCVNWAPIISTTSFNHIQIVQN